MDYCRISNRLQSIVPTVKLLNDPENIKRSKNICIRLARTYYRSKDGEST